jgi:hypothetical protein
MRPSAPVRHFMVRRNASTFTATVEEREQLLATQSRGLIIREQARRAVDEASQQRIKILEQLMGICLAFVAVER